MNEPEEVPVLYVLFEDGQEMQWHVGEPKFSVNGVKEIQADGDELTWIVNYFAFIPSAKCPVNVWPNPWATFIARNMA